MSMRCKHGQPNDSTSPKCLACVIEDCTEQIVAKLDVLIKQAEQPKRESSSRSIRVLNLSARVYNCLKHNNIIAIVELKDMPDHQLLRLRGFGRASLSKVKRALDEFEVSTGEQDETL